MINKKYINNLKKLNDIHNHIFKNLIKKKENNLNKNFYSSRIKSNNKLLINLNSNFNTSSKGNNLKLKKDNYNYKVISKTIGGSVNYKLKENQDKYFFIKNLLGNKNNILLGVIDGHGDNGSLVAEYIKNNYYKILKNYLKENLKKIEIIRFLKISFIELNKNLIKNSNINVTFSGCTLSVVLIFNHYIYCANVGDSECFLIKKNNKFINIKNIIKISKNHHPINEKENKRIIECGGEIHGYIDKYNNEHFPLRIWIKNQSYPGLNMTRCFGDTVGRRIGVISTPYISITKLKDNIKFIILGSDGLWDNLKPSDILKEINNNQFSCIIENLVINSLNLWKKDNEEYIDDITCLALKIN